MQPGKLSLWQVLENLSLQFLQIKTHTIIESVGPAEVFDWKNVGK